MLRTAAARRTVEREPGIPGYFKNWLFDPRSCGRSTLESCEARNGVWKFVLLHCKPFTRNLHYKSGGRVTVTVSSVKTFPCKLVEVISPSGSATFWSAASTGHLGVFMMIGHLGRKIDQQAPKWPLLGPLGGPNSRTKPKPRHLVGKKIILTLLTNPMHREIASHL